LTTSRGQNSSRFCGVGNCLKEPRLPAGDNIPHFASDLSIRVFASNSKWQFAFLSPHQGFPRLYPLGGAPDAQTAKATNLGGRTLKPASAEITESGFRPRLKKPELGGRQCHLLIGNRKPQPNVTGTYTSHLRSFRRFGLYFPRIFLYFGPRYRSTSLHVGVGFESTSGIFSGI
jgi:hypothetical protein